VSGDEDRDEPFRQAPGPAHREDAAAETAEQALTRAATHARSALAESLHALQALLDAASLATSGAPAETRRVLGPLSRTLAGLASGLEGDASDGALGLLAAVAEALDAEIARWELRARDDADARAVLRAFLGLRELLWEFGVRRPESAERAAGAGARLRPRPRRARPRVQRVRVEG
jgi:hypothetical protein